MPGDKQQQRATFATVSGAAMPWASSSSSSSTCHLQQQRPPRQHHLVPASMTFGLPFAGGFGRAAGGGRCALPFASVGASAAVGGVPSLFATKKTEEHTGIAFPDSLCVISSRDCPGLAGVG